MRAHLCFFTVEPHYLFIAYFHSHTIGYFLIGFVFGHDQLDTLCTNFVLLVFLSTFNDTRRVEIGDIETYFVEVFIALSYHF